MLKRKSAGYSLVELMVAIGVLAVVTAPIVMLYTFGTRMAAAAHRQTIAAILAQQRVEELVGLSQDDLEDEYDPANNGEYVSGLYVALDGAPDYSISEPDFANPLAQVTVQVFYDVAEGPIVEQTVVIALEPEEPPAGP